MYLKPLALVLVLLSLLAATDPDGALASETISRALALVTAGILRRSLLKPTSSSTKPATAKRRRSPTSSSTKPATAKRQRSPTSPATAKRRGSPTRTKSGS